MIWAAIAAWVAFVAIVVAFWDPPEGIRFDRRDWGIATAAKLLFFALGGFNSFWVAVALLVEALLAIFLCFWKQTQALGRRMLIATACVLLLCYVGIHCYFRLA